MKSPTVVFSLPELHDALRQVPASEEAPRVLVPTMGALHAGHASLLSKGRELAGDQGTLIATIFVNPTQFGPDEDLDAYPRTFAADLEICQNHRVDVVLAPKVEDMYPPRPSPTTKVIETSLSSGLCGAARPGHFDGVCTVVLKLFNLTQPQIAVFGKKDYQQLAVLRRMVRDLNVPVKIIGCETKREPDGLAMSSRNSYLSAKERTQAPAIRKALLAAQTSYLAGEREVSNIDKQIRNQLSGEAPEGKIDYLAIVDAETLRPLESLREANSILIAIAVFFGKKRLIDNLELLVPSISR